MQTNPGYEFEVTQTVTFTFRVRVEGSASVSEASKRAKEIAEGRGDVNADSATYGKLRARVIGVSE